MANITTDNINTIAQLAASINDGDYILIYKAGAQAFSKIEKSVFVQAFGAGGINVDDIVNNCTDGGVDKALSAEMGKVLKDNLTIVQSNVQLLLDTLSNLAFTNVPKPTLTPIDWSATPYISVSPSSLSFSAVAGGTSSATFTVNGSNLTGSLSVAVSGSNASLFTVNKSTITANEAASGVTITVTYQPGARGTHSAMITISGGGASQKTISLNGTAASQDVTTYNVIPNLIHLNMNPNGGTVESGGTFSGVISVEDSTLYDLPTSIQVSGTHGTISYNSTTGAFSIPNITSNIEITASAADKPVATPTLTATPSTININGTVDEQTSATFFVQGTNLTDKVSIAFVVPSGTVGWMYTQSIPIANATRGHTCTLYWTPESEVTNAIGKITISSDGATSKEITVNATATAQDQPSLLNVVRGWALSEDKAVMTTKINNGEAVSGETYKWTFPRKLFAANGTTQLDGSGIENNTSYTLPVVNVCYTGFIKIPASATSYLLYVHGIRKPYSASSVTTLMFTSIVFYKLENGVFTPIYAKGTQIVDARHSGEMRLFNIGSDSGFANVKTAIASGNAYVRMSFEMSDANTIVENKTITKISGDPSNAPSTITCGLYACNSTGGNLESIWDASNGYTVVDNPFRYDKDDLLTEQDTGTYTD